MTGLRVDIETSSREFIQAIHDASALLESEGIDVDEPIRVPGFGETAYQISAAIGVISLPVGVLGNLLASWIWEGVKARKQLVEALIVIRTESGEVQVELRGQDQKTLLKALTLALRRVGPK
jgi:hypothetical protein